MTTMSNEEIIIERLRLKIPNAHIFKLPPKPSAGGWRGAEWHDKLWQGTLKVVERNDQTAVLLVDAHNESSIFAVCPITHQLDEGHSTNGGNGVDRCIDSSRYFVLRIQNAQNGRRMYIGLAFNERNDAFDFNTALEDSRREKMAEKKAAALGRNNTNTPFGSSSVDYKMKEGEKIKVSIGNNNNTTIGSGNSGGGAAAARRRSGKARSSNTGSGGFLKPSSKDTPSRLA